MGLEEIWNELVNLFGDRLAHPDHEPKRFAYQVKIYKHINKYGQKPKTTNPQGN